MEWSDQKFKEATTKYSDWYKPIKGVKDVIRIISGASIVYRHNWFIGSNVSSNFRTAMCAKDNEGKHSSCPYCDKLDSDGGIIDHQRKMTFATTVLHITRQSLESGSKPKFIGKVLAWRFNEDKKTPLVEIDDLTGGNLKKTDLQIRIAAGAEAEKYQKVTITHIPKPGVFDKLPEKLKKQCLLEIKNKKEEIFKQYNPSPDDLKKWIKADEEVDSFDPNELDIGEEKQVKDKSNPADGEDVPFDLDTDLKEEEEKPVKAKGKVKVKPKEKVKEEKESNGDALDFEGELDELGK